MFSQASNPIFFSEYGCNEVIPRIFTEVEAVYSEEMMGAFAGGLIYEYSQEENEYGLVKINGNGSATLLADYDSLRKQFLNLDVGMLQSLNVATTANEPPACNASLIKSRDFLTKFDLPKLPPGGAELLGKGVGGASHGRVVDIRKTTSLPKVYDVDGRPLEKLKLNAVVDHWNVPGENTSGMRFSSEAGKKERDDSESAAAGRSVTVGVGSMVSAVAGLFLLV